MKYPDFIRVGDNYLSLRFHWIFSYCGYEIEYSVIRTRHKGLDKYTTYKLFEN